MLAGGHAENAYHQPTLLVDLPLEADILWEETFGPVLAVAKVDSLEEAVEISDRSRYGLDFHLLVQSRNVWKAAGVLELAKST